ncbi:MAG: FKBP-type peptidyl-prolyl cis-trans isomerase FkpA [Bacteroidia bacterium]|jgi:FKBP-type peptidyl-prolyl cis-trans isomerase FkpA
MRIKMMCIKNGVRKYGIVGLCLVAVSIAGCKKDYVEINDTEIQDYIASNGLQAKKTDEGLYYVIGEEGVGTRPTVSNRVTVHYNGYLLNGNVFDSSYDRGEKSTFSLGGVIEGWKLGIPLIKEGGSIKLIVPSHLAYGSQPPSRSIPENAVLVFDIELFSVL